MIPRTAQGKQLSCFVYTFYIGSGETDSAEGRQFAMMAALGWHVMFTVWFVFLVGFNFVVCGTMNGTSVVYFCSVISGLCFNSAQEAFCSR